MIIKLHFSLSSKQNMLILILNRFYNLCYFLYLGANYGGNMGV